MASTNSATFKNVHFSVHDYYPTHTMIIQMHAINYV